MLFLREIIENLLLIEVLLFERLFFILSEILLLCLAALSNAKFSFSVGALGDNRDGVFLSEGTDEEASKLVIRGTIGREETHEINEVILREDSIIYSLETRVALNGLGKGRAFSFAEIPAQEIVDRELSFSAVVQ